MLFSLWSGSTYRPTRDLDFAGYGQEDFLVECIREVCSMTDVDDGIVFFPDTLESKPIRAAAEYHGTRVKFKAGLENASIPVQIDFGIGDAIEPSPLDVEYPTLLGGPGPRVRAYPQEAVIAEKVHAMIFLGMANSRMKDFFDVYVLSEKFSFSGETLRGAVAATFFARKTSVPSSLNNLESFFSDRDKRSSWLAFLNRNELLEAPEDFMIVGSRLQIFLSPVLASISNDDRFRSTWQPGGPWSMVPE